jgi:voltage-gated potassium channel
VIAIVLLTVQGLHPDMREALVHLDGVLGVFFVLEYVVRLGATQLEGRSLRKLGAYQTSFFGWVDLLSILPVLVPLFFGSGLATLKALRLFRLLRVLKLVRHNQSLHRLGRVMKSIQSALLTTLFLTFLIVVITSIFMYNIEHEAQPEAFPNVVATFWWAITTLTTVGYGDIFPVTALGKLFSALLSVLGIGIIAIPTGLISAAYVKELDEGQPGDTP